MADYQSLMLVFGAWIALSCLYGIIEAQLFHDYPFLGLSFKYIHHVFTVVRGISAGVMIVWTGVTWWVVVPMACVFPFFHDGSYYFGRNYLDDRLYRLRWRARSTTTTAFFSLRYSDRLYFFWVGVLVFAWLVIAKVIL